MAIDQVINYINDNRQRYVDELFELLRIPSVSAVSEHKDDVARAAEFVAEQFRSIGFKTEIHQTPGHPIVYAEFLPADAPTDSAAGAIARIRFARAISTASPA